MLKEGGRSMHSGGSRRVRRTLVAIEVALAVVTLTGAGMLLRSLTNLQSADLGFDTRSTLTARVSPLGYDEARTTVFYDQILAELRATPGVQSAAAAGWLPVVGSGGMWGVLAEGTSYDQMPQAPMAVPQQATTGFVRAMGMRVLHGRDFTEEDRAGAVPVALVSKLMAEQLWPNADPLGKRFRLGGGQTFVTVVGVVNDFRSRGFADMPEPTMYFAFPQTHQSSYVMPRSMTLVVRTEGDPLAIERELRSIVKSLDGSAPVSEVRTLEQVVGTSVAQRRFATLLIAAFAALALVLAGIGIYGVIAFGVSERTFEIGVRMALGAERSRVLRLVVRDGVWTAAAGAVVGLVGSVAAARAIRSLLVGVTTIDVPTMVVVSAVLLIVVICAGVIPARRALAVSPTQALRGE
jgi:predicted permease